MSSLFNSWSRQARAGTLKVAAMLKRAVAARASSAAPGLLERAAVVPAAPEAPASTAALLQVEQGQFLQRSFTNLAGSRDYKLYVPAMRGVAAMPLVVMLHGCQQDPDDFAAGSRMNQLAERHGFLVAYPAQAPAANGMKCWNWFSIRNQGRDHGEPSLIAGITRAVAAEFSVDSRRIVIVGMSAGAAMAVILAVTYPELYAGLGVHSGLPYGAARSAASALAAMRGSRPAPSTRAGLSAARIAAMGEVARAKRTIVFHGDSDVAVNPLNGSRIVDQAVARAEALRGPMQKIVRATATAGGREFSTICYQDAAAATVIEHWLIHGAGHAWSGGSAKGSYTDESGPDASAEMVRFLLPG